MTPLTPCCSLCDPLWPPVCVYVTTGSIRDLGRQFCVRDTRQNSKVSSLSYIQPRPTPINYNILSFQFYSSIINYTPTPIITPSNYIPPFQIYSSIIAPHSNSFTWLHLHSDYIYSPLLLLQYIIKDSCFGSQAEADGGRSWRQWWWWALRQEKENKHLPQDPASEPQSVIGRSQKTWIYEQTWGAASHQTLTPVISFLIGPQPPPTCWQCIICITPFKVIVRIKVGRIKKLIGKKLLHK